MHGNSVIRVTRSQFRFECMGPMGDSTEADIRTPDLPPLLQNKDQLPCSC